jgi:hypothetical protein
VRGAERECANSVQHGLQRHHREAREEHHGAERDQVAGALAVRARRRGVFACGNAGFPGFRLVFVEERKREPGSQIDEPHRGHGELETEPRNQHEACGERTRECARGVACIDECVKARRLFEASRQALREQRDRAAHQDRRRTHQDCGEKHVDRECPARGKVRKLERDGTDPSEEQGEEQSVETDRRLDDSIEEKQPRASISARRVAHPVAREPPEERVSDRQSAQEDPEHRGCGLAVGAEQGRQEPLPGDLVDQRAESRQNCQHQSRAANHGAPSR